MKEKIIKFNEYDITLKPFNIFLLYTYFLMVLMYIAGGDGYIFGTIILVMNLLTSFFAFYYFRTSTIKEVKITDDKIIFTHIKNKKYQKSEYLLKDLKISAQIEPIIYFYKIRHYKKISIYLSINNTLQNNPTEYISDQSEIIEHSLNIIKFLKTLDCVEFEVVNYDECAKSNYIEWSNTVKNYIEKGIFNKKDYDYANKILTGLAFVLLSILLLGGMALLTIIYLDFIHLLN